MYNRYIPEGSQYTPVEPERHTSQSGQGPDRGKKAAGELMKRLRLEKLDSGDLLLLLIVLLLWKDSEDPDLLLALGGAILLGDGEE